MKRKAKKRRLLLQENPTSYANKSTWNSVSMPVEDEKTKEAQKMINTKHYQSILDTEPTLLGRVHWGLRHTAKFSLHYRDCYVIFWEIVFLQEKLALLIVWQGIKRINRRKAEIIISAGNFLWAFHAWKTGVCLERPYTKFEGRTRKSTLRSWGFRLCAWQTDRKCWKQTMNTITNHVELGQESLEAGMPASDCHTKLTLSTSHAHEPSPNISGSING